VDVAVVGGTGAEGRGLTLRLAAAGHHVTIGSREAHRGAEVAAELSASLDVPEAAAWNQGPGSARGIIEGTDNATAAGSVDVTLVTVPFAGQAEIYRSIKDAVRRGAVVLDATSPLATAVGGRPWQVVRPWHGSAAEQARAILGDGPRLVSGFHTIAAKALAALPLPIESDVLLCGDDDEAKATIGSLVDDIPGLRWVDCGDLSAARIAETLTALLVDVNRRYQVHDSGFRVIGREAWGRP
jgi:8-hydroxy-5-deazaflavin:NADPH oxidoreductase